MAVKMVNLTIDNQSVNVPAGTLVVDAAKKAGIDIPVFAITPSWIRWGCAVCVWWRSGARQ